MIRRPPRSPLFPSTPLFRSSLAMWSPMSIRSCRDLGEKVTATIKQRSEEHTSELQSQFHLLFPLVFFLNDPAPPEISPLSLHAALPIFLGDVVADVDKVLPGLGRESYRNHQA